MSKGFTYEEHDEMAAQLYEMYEQIVKITVNIGKQYGVTSKEHRESDKIYRALMELRSVMEERLLKEHPEQFSTKVYYRAWNRENRAAS